LLSIAGGFLFGQAFTAKGVLTRQLFLALIGLACLALVPVVYKKLRRSP